MVFSLNSSSDESLQLQNSAVQPCMRCLMVHAAQLWNIGTLHTGTLADGFASALAVPVIEGVMGLEMVSRLREGGVGASLPSVVSK